MEGVGGGEEHVQLYFRQRLMRCGPIRISTGWLCLACLPNTALGN